MSDKTYVYFIDIDTEKKFRNGSFIRTEKQRFADVYIGITLERAIEIGVEYLADQYYTSYEFTIKIYDSSTQMFNIESMYDDESNKKFMNEYSSTKSLEERYRLLLHYSNFFELHYTDKGEFIASYFDSPNYTHPLCGEILGEEPKFKIGELVKFIDRKTGVIYPEIYEVLETPCPMTKFQYPLFCESGYQ